MSEEFEITKEQLDRIFNGECEKTNESDALHEILTSRTRNPEDERLTADAIRLCGKAKNQLERIKIDGIAVWGDDLQSIADKCRLLSRKLESCKEPEGLGEEIGELCSEMAQRLRMEQTAMADTFMRAGQLLKLISDKCELI